MELSVLTKLLIINALMSIHLQSCSTGGVQGGEMDHLGSFVR